MEPSFKAGLIYPDLSEPSIYKIINSDKITGG